MRKSRHIIVYAQGTPENIALAAAKHGASDRAIQRILRERGFANLSDTQINTRLAKAKLWEQKQVGYRVAYRNGMSTEFKQMLNDRIAITEAEIARTLPKRILNPTPKILEYVEEHRYVPRKERQKWEREMQSQRKQKKQAA